MQQRKRKCGEDLEPLNSKKHHKGKENRQPPFVWFVKFDKEMKMWVEVKFALWANSKFATIDAIDRMMEIAGEGARTKITVKEIDGCWRTFVLHDASNALLAWVSTHGGKRFPYTAEEWAHNHISDSRRFQVFSQRQFDSLCREEGAAVILSQMKDNLSGLEEVLQHSESIPESERRAAIESETCRAISVLQGFIQQLSTNE